MDGINKQDVIQGTIEFYDTKARAKRLLLVADTTDNNEYICFNITSKKPDKDNAQYDGNVFVPHTPENRLRYDSYVKCDVEYVIATDSIYTDIRKTPIRLNDAEFRNVMAKYEHLKAEKAVKRFYNTVEPKKEEFETLKAQVIQSVEKYKSDPRLMTELIDFRSKFYNYSFNNAMLIMMQNPYATHVASFKKWNALGYRVNKGEHGIKILAPYEVTYFRREDDWVNVRSATRAELDRIYKNQIETRKQTYFTVGHVYDISQTNCPASDYPRFYDMGYASVEHAVLYESLKAFAEKSGFSVAEDKINSIALKGFYSPDTDHITINNRLNDSEKLATLTHEFAHALMHKTTTQSKELTEFEAECLSHMLQRRLNLPITDNNKGYLASYYTKVKADELELDKSFQRISKAFAHAAEGFDRELKDRGIVIGQDREQSQKQEKAVQVAEAVNRNFHPGPEQGVR